jgi:hypothetical protein
LFVTCFTIYSHDIVVYINVSAPKRSIFSSKHAYVLGVHVLAHAGPLFLLVSQFYLDDTQIQASTGSNFEIISVVTNKLKMGQRSVLLLQRIGFTQHLKEHGLSKIFLLTLDI